MGTSPTHTPSRNSGEKWKVIKRFREQNEHQGQSLSVASTSNEKAAFYLAIRPRLEYLLADFADNPCEFIVTLLQNSVPEQLWQLFELKYGQLVHAGQAPPLPSILDPLLLLNILGVYLFDVDYAKHDAERAMSSFVIGTSTIKEVGVLELLKISRIAQASPAKFIAALVRALHSSDRGQPKH